MVIGVQLKKLKNNIRIKKEMHRYNFCGITKRKAGRALCLCLSLVIGIMNSSGYMLEKSNAAAAGNIFQNGNITAFGKSVSYTTTVDTESMHLYKSAANAVLKNVKEPTVASTGGEWAIIGLVRGNMTVPENYYENYYKRVEDYVKQMMKAQGTLHKYKSTEYSRLILSLTALGKDVTQVGGYNLLEGLSSMSYLKKQGINGSVWALIALDSYNYKIPAAKNKEDQVTREGLVAYILSNQQADGGWKLGAKSKDDASEVDMTAMALQALAPYKNQEEVEEAVSKALKYLSDMQGEDGGFAFQKSSSTESIAQVIVALTALSISPFEDARFQKNGKNMLDALKEFQTENGGFAHVKLADGSVKYNQMATEQVLYALAAYNRFLAKETSLYDMKDVSVAKKLILNAVTWKNVKYKSDKQSNASASSVKKTAVLSWNAVKNADGYEILQASKKNGEYKVVRRLTGAAKNKTTLAVKNGKAAYIKIRAFKKDGNNFSFGKESSIKKLQGK